MTQGSENHNPEQSEKVITTDQMFHEFAEICVLRGSLVKTHTEEDGTGFMLADIPPLTEKGIKAVTYKPPYTFDGEPMGNVLCIEFDEPEILKVVDLYVDETGHVTHQVLTLDSIFVDPQEAAHIQEIARDPSRDALIEEAIDAFEQQGGFSDDPELREIQHKLLYASGESSPSPEDIEAVQEALAATKLWRKAK